MNIDQLYQLPLGEFTNARNLLAKGATGATAAAIRALEKPSAAAWAVNQLYWRERRAYDKLVRASERVRAAHALKLKGKSADLATLELQHKAAVKEAADLVRALLTGAGDPASPATLKAVTDTLQTLPGPGQPGRLTKPLGPVGFEALSALLSGSATPKAMADVVAFVKPKPPKPTRDEIDRAEARAKEIERERQQEAERAARAAAKSLAIARTKLERAERDRDDLDTKLADLQVAIAKLRTEITRLERESRAAGLRS